MKVLAVISNDGTSHRSLVNVAVRGFLVHSHESVSPAILRVVHADQLEHHFMEIVDVVFFAGNVLAAFVGHGDHDKSCDVFAMLWLGFNDNHFLLGC